jgi:hypothetical protein
VRKFGILSQDDPVECLAAQFPARPCDRVRRSWLQRFKLAQSSEQDGGSTSHTCIGRAVVNVVVIVSGGGDKTDVRRHSRVGE